MLGDATRALTQMFTPALWNVLMKTVVLAIAMLAVLVVVLFRLLAWLSANGLHWAEGIFGAAAHIPLGGIGMASCNRTRVRPFCRSDPADARGHLADR